MLLYQLVGLSFLSAPTPPPPTHPLFAPAPRPITEVDVYQGMADFFTLAGEEKSLLVSAGTGYVGDGIATVDVAYRRDGYRGLWELLPTTIGASLWGRTGDDNVALTASLGYTLVLGLFEGPYITANALARWSPQSSSFAAGFDSGLGWEVRSPSLKWSLTADVRLVKLWPVDDGDGSPWGGRLSLGVRRYLDL